MSSCGTSNGDVKLYTSQHVDKITTHYANCGSVKFITSEPKNRRTRIIGHQFGDIEFYNVDTLKANHENYRLDLNPGEEITCGTYSQNGLNFAVGTSFGSIYILGKKKEKHYGKVSNTWQFTRVDAITNDDQKSAVTSIKLSVFDPTGALLVAFDDGKVRVWKSKVKDELINEFNIMKNKSKKRKDIPQQDLLGLDFVQFDVIDKFDMLENPHDDLDYTEEQEEAHKKLYNRKYP